MKKLHVLVALMILSGQILLAQKIISGVVKDPDGMLLPGATVVVEGTNNGAVTDFDGHYELNVKSINAVLNISYVGYITKKITIGDRSNIDVVLEADSNVLDEVVVVGYGTQKKSDITGAVASVSAKTLEERPQVNIQQALQGTLPGVNISVNSNTASGASTSLNIRGRRSISGGSDPLIVLDGVIFSGTLSEVNINDIQNIEVLKDASSSAIYGARGANGVILLTTKKGTKEGKPKLNLSSYYGSDFTYDLPDMMDAETFYQRKVERFGEAYLTETERQVYANGTAVDWIDLALRDGSRMEHNVSISGGSETSSYFISGNFQDVEGVAVNDDFSKVNFRANIKVDLNNWLEIGTNTLFGFSDKSGNSVSFTEAFYMNPLTVAYNEDGSITKQPWPEESGFGNPLENLLYQNTDKSNSLITNNYIKIDFPFIEGLSYKLNTGYTLRNTKEQNYRGRDTQAGAEVNGFANEEIGESKDWLVENVLSYNKSFGKHNIFATGLYSAQERTYERLYVRGTGFPNDVRGYYQFNDAEVLVSSAGYDKRSNVSQMLRVNYNFDSKYLLTVTGRRDGYSAFGEDAKYGFFPSVALGWNIADESFLQDNNTINKLKLRVSYGENGNQAISPYRTLSDLIKQDYIDGSGNNLVGYRPGGLGNGNLGWETTTSFNVGVDFGLYNSRITGSLDVYTSNTTDLLLSKSIPGINGSTSIIQNIGETKGSGIELALGSRNIATDNFKWNSQLSFTRTLNEIVNVGLKDEAGKYIDDIGSKWFIGQPIDVDYGYVYDGIWQLDEVDEVDLKDWGVNQAGDVKYKDISGPEGVPDGKITDLDRQVIGSLQPDFSIGLTNNLTYKDFSLDFFMYMVEGVTKRNELYTTDDWALRRRGYNLNYWSPTNPTNDFPENADRTTNPNHAAWYQDASYVRLKEVTLAYNLPQQTLDKIGFNNLSVYINAKNLFTLTDWTGIDPEASSQRDRPFSRSFLLGIRLGL